MLSKIFISVLLLTCVYTYMLKSIKDENDTHFQKLPDNSNLELNGIEPVKPNLKILEPVVFKMYLKSIFGLGFVQKMEKHYFDRESQFDLFNYDMLAKINMCNKPEEQKEVFNNHLSSTFEKKMEIMDHAEMKNELYKYQDSFKTKHEMIAWRAQIKWLMVYIKEYS